MAQSISLIMPVKLNLAKISKIKSIPLLNNCNKINVNYWLNLKYIVEFVVVYFILFFKISILILMNF